jgi:S1-C subfamily serine protease
VLTAVNDHAVDSVEDLIALPGHAEPQEELELTLSRGGEELHVKVRLARPEPDSPGAGQPD